MNHSIGGESKSDGGTATASLRFDNALSGFGGIGNPYDAGVKNGGELNSTIHASFLVYGQSSGATKYHTDAMIAATEIISTAPRATCVAQCRARNHSSASS